MATAMDWERAFARQGRADLETFEKMQLQEFSIPVCHMLQFLQMACEKLAKAYLCGTGSDPTVLQTSHAYVAKTLPIVIREQADHVNLGSQKTEGLVKRARHLFQEIEMLAPAVKRGGKRPDNCEYPWADDTETVHVPLDWTFHPAKFISDHAGRTILKLVKGAFARTLE